MSLVCSGNGDQASMTGVNSGHQWQKMRLQMQAGEGHKDEFSYYCKSYGKTLEEFKPRNNIICITFQVITPAAL